MLHLPLSPADARYAIRFIFAMQIFADIERRFAAAEVSIFSIAIFAAAFR